VTGNLYEALSSLRKETEAGFWWIDALCINQADVEERSLQVLRMTSIYRTAFHVVAWIGSETPGQPNLQQYLKSSASLLRLDSQTSPGIGHFYDLLSRKYWRRMWIVQEVSVATDLWIVCGSSSVNWDTLCRVIDLYEELERKKPYNDNAKLDDSDSRARQVTSRAHDDQLQIRFSWEPVACSAVDTIALQAVTVSTEDNLVKSYDGLKTFRDFRSLLAQQQTPIGFLEALKKTSAFLATDDRDRIYALLGLVHDGRSFFPTPDYKIGFDDLKTQMTRNFLHATKNLDVLIACGHRQVLDGCVPSWTLDWLNLGFEAEYAFFQRPRVEIYGCW
jgi:hypothetical protein